MAVVVVGTGAPHRGGNDESGSDYCQAWPVAPALCMLGVGVEQWRGSSSVLELCDSKSTIVVQNSLSTQKVRLFFSARNAAVHSDLTRPHQRPGRAPLPGCLRRSDRPWLCAQPHIKVSRSRPNKRPAAGAVRSRRPRSGGLYAVDLNRVAKQASAKAVAVRRAVGTHLVAAARCMRHACVMLVQSADAVPGRNVGEHHEYMRGMWYTRSSGRRRLGGGARGGGRRRKVVGWEGGGGGAPAASSEMLCSATRARRSVCLSSSCLA
jgi:hypothetical protein